MRIVLLSPYWRPVPGGPAHYLAGLRDKLAADGHEVRVLALEGEPEADVAVVRQRPLPLWRTLSRFFRRVRPDIVHVHGHWTLLFPAVWSKLLHRSGRVVFTFHTATRTRGFRRAVLRYLINRCDFVTAVSADLLAREVRRLRIRVPVAVTYPGVDLPEVSKEAGQRFRASLGIGLEDRLVLAVSPLQYERKVAGLLDLIRAVPAIRPAGRNVHVVVLGAGQYFPVVRSLVQDLALEGRVHLVGALENPADAFSAADVVAHVSYQDELPLAILEAMAHGKPILCSAIGGIPEVLEDQKEGLYVEGGPAAIAQGIERLLSDHLAARQYGEAARRRVQASFTRPQAFRQVEAIYGSVRRKRVHVSVDVEEDYKLPGPSYRGIVEALPRLLDLFREHGVRASFFVTADVARRYPEVVRRLRDEGHHVGSHGLSHAAPPFAGQPYTLQVREVAEAFGALGSSATQPLAFRAPNFRVDAHTISALAANGIWVDSSVVPERIVRRTRGAPGMDFRGAPAWPYRLSVSRPSFVGLAGVLEVPLASNPHAAGSPLGLGYLNLAGADRTLEALAALPQRDIVFLIHPWEAVDYPEGLPRPTWMQRGCTSDLSKMQAFLGAVARDHELVAFSPLLESPLTLNFRWWSPGPWGTMIRRPRVLFVTNVFRPITGGVTTYLGGLRDALIAEGFDVRLMSYPARLVRREAADPHNPTRKVRHLAFASVCLLRIALWRLRGEPVLVHSHGASFCLLVSYVAKWMGAVGLHTFHSPLTHPSRILQWFGPRLDALLYVSEETRRLYEASNQLFHDRIAVVPGGVVPAETGLLSPEERLELRRRSALPADAFVVLFVGRVVRDKGVHVALSAMPTLLEEAPGARLLVAGPRGESKDDEAYFRELEDAVSKRGLRDVVRFLGRVREEDLPGLYGVADCLVVPSIWEEPAPMVVVEAMAEGLPVVASSTGGLPSRVGDRVTGLLFPPGNAKELAKRLGYLARDRAARDAFGRAAHRWVLENATARGLAEYHSRIYQGLWREARLP